MQEFDLDHDVSPFEFVWFTNMALLSVQLQPWVDNSSIFSLKHGSHFRSITAQVLSWIIAQDVSASRMRTVSFIELYVAFRLSRVGRGPVGPGGCDSRFQAVTFASDFSFFKGVLRLIFQTADISWGTKVDLSFLRTYTPQQGVQIGWTAEVEQSTFGALSSFIGARPVVNAQALAKPWIPERDA